MITDSEISTSIITLAKPFVKAFVDVYIKPLLEKSNSKNHSTGNLSDMPTDEHFNEYYLNKFKDFSIMNTLVFRNSQKRLKDLYIPLTIHSHVLNKSYKMVGYPQKLLHQHRRVLITDTAGMGKSTLAKLFFIDIIEKKFGIPILIELRRLSKNHTVLQAISKQLNSVGKSEDPKWLLEMIKSGNFIFIFDGFDEISLSERQGVTIDIQTFISKASENKFILTSRPEGSLSGFGDFLDFNIEPLEKSEAIELLKKYDNNGASSELLIKKLNDSELNNIDEFLTNPLLVSLLFTAFEYKQAIPFKKHLFYRQVFDANFEAHDLTKGDSYTHDKESKLEIDDFHKMLRYLGFASFKMQKIEFSKDQILKIIEDGRIFCVGLDFKPSDFLNDLTNSVPLFVIEGNYYRWAHKSLQEYFTAQFIWLDTKNKQNVLLLDIYNHQSIDNFINILDLYYDIDYRTFRNVIEFELLTEYKKHLDSLKKLALGGISNDSLLDRAEVTFLSESLLFSTPFLITEDTPHDFSEMRKTYIVENELNYDTLSNVLTNVSVNPRIVYCLTFEFPKFSLILLLRDKKCKFLKEEDKFTERKNLIPKSYFKKHYYPLVINQDKNNILNKKHIFKKVNEVIGNNRWHSCYIDTTKALSALEEIKSSLTVDDNDFLSIK